MHCIIQLVIATPCFLALPGCSKPVASQSNINSSGVLKQVWKEQPLGEHPLGSVDLIGWFALEEQN